MLRKLFASAWFHRRLYAVREWAWRTGRVRLIPRGEGDTEVYLERIFLLDSAWMPRGWGLFLHRFWLSDNEGLHDHPWNFLTLILRGSYHEETFGAERGHPRAAGDWAWRRAEEFHRVDLGTSEPGEVWTLFWHGKRRRQWGFVERGTEVEWKAGPANAMTPIVAYPLPDTPPDGLVRFGLGGPRAAGYDAYDLQQQAYVRFDGALLQAEKAPKDWGSYRLRMLGLAQEPRKRYTPRSTGDKTR